MTSFFSLDGERYFNLAHVIELELVPGGTYIHMTGDTRIFAKGITPSDFIEEFVPR